MLFRFDVAMEGLQLLGDSLHNSLHMYVQQCFTCSSLKVFHQCFVAAVVQSYPRVPGKST